MKGDDLCKEQKRVDLENQKDWRKANNRQDKIMRIVLPFLQIFCAKKKKEKRHETHHLPVLLFSNAVSVYG